MSAKQNLNDGNEILEKQWKSIYILGFITTLLVIFGSISDIAISFALGGDLTTIPKTAVDRFSQFQTNWLVGLYNLDMLNLITTVLMIPSYLALYSAHRNGNKAYVKLSLLIFTIGSAIFITNNTALPMLELSRNYFASTSETQRSLYAAAGEAMLARGAHGSSGAFLGFIITTIANIVLSIGMLKGRIFSMATAIIGICGGSLLMIYLILITFVPGTDTMAMMIATPGGLLSLAWMAMFSIKLFRVGLNE
ncbi:MAG: DUF4386 family protein [Saccharofermentanales bacterium]